MSKRLNEEAERYLEDFITNIEDTDFSSFDGERSDTSSTLLGTTKPTSSNPAPVGGIGIKSVPVEMEGVNLPWLKWDDTDSVAVALPPTTPTPTLKTKLWDPSQVNILFIFTVIPV